MIQDSETTRQLLERAREGTPDFDELFRRHRERLKAAVELRLDRQLRNRMDASDIIQEAHAETFRRLDDFLQRRPMPFYVWLRKTAQERLIMARRRHIDAERRAAGRELPLPRHSTAMLGREMLAQEKSPSRLVSEEELAAQVRRAVAQLSDLNREVLLMRVYENLSYDEIAAILDIDAAAARKRNGRALVQLHGLLSRDGLSESQL
ncbi:MAG: sigma-70 family RNA polymerase sigma factor [Planctomycetaceae bacterium]|nr:sigma-70 family RNA polymerase sigma factor [Planctomycetaceae bacterium]